MILFRSEHNPESDFTKPHFQSLWYAHENTYYSKQPYWQLQLYSSQLHQSAKRSALHSLPLVFWWLSGAKVHRCRCLLDWLTLSWPCLLLIWWSYRCIWHFLRTWTRMMSQNWWHWSMYPEEDSWWIKLVLLSLSGFYLRPSTHFYQWRKYINS